MKIINFIAQKVLQNIYICYHEKDKYFKFMFTNERII